MYLVDTFSQSTKYIYVARYLIAIKRKGVRDMKVSFKWIHRGVNVTVWGMFVLSAIYMFAKWKNIPDWAGVHFDLVTREFDVYASKWFCLYPHVVNIITLVAMGVAHILTRTVKVGMKINAIGEEKLRTFLNVIIDVLQLVIVGFFTHWSWCVTRQESFSKVVMDISTFGLCGAIVLIVVGTIMIRIIYCIKKEG